MNEPRHRRGWARRFEWQVAIVGCALALPAAAFGMLYIWQLPLGSLARVLAGSLLVLVLAVLLRRLVTTVSGPLRGLASVVEAYRGGDYTLRGSRPLRGDALGDLVIEINTLGDTLHQQRLKAMEATALLDKLIAGIGVAVLAFDGERQLRVINPVAAQLLGVSLDAAAGRSARELGVDGLLNDAVRTRIVTSIGGRAGRWQVIHGAFRESGLAQHLLIISDVQHALREEERAAWQRLIRVIGHEVNNSLAPIKSMAESLQSLLAGVLEEGGSREDTLGALRVIAERTAGLGRFLAQYSRLARVPTARPRWQPLAPVLARIGALESLQRVRIQVSPELQANVDADHLEQALINLAKNAVEAQTEGGGQVTLDARADGVDLVITVTDEGLGVANADNLFVPFFTTKAGGSGIGLILSRQIVEAHGGALSLENRTDRRGAVARLVLPGAARA